MYHSIIFQRAGLAQKNTWDDWGLIPTSRPVIAPPKLKEKYITVPGASGMIDLCEAVKRYPLYERREGTMEFLVVNEEGRDWHDLYADIENYINGYEISAMLEDDLFHYYKGRFFLKSWEPGEHWSKVTIGYNVNPYKFRLFTSIEDWQWDPFNFNIGVFQKDIFNQIYVQGVAVIDISPENYIGRMPVVPSFIIDSDDEEGLNVSLVNNELGINKQVHFNDGTFSDPGLIFSNVSGKNDISLKFMGYGYVSVDFRSGGL